MEKAHNLASPAHRREKPKHGQQEVAQAHNVSNMPGAIKPIIPTPQYQLSIENILREAKVRIENTITSPDSIAMARILDIYLTSITKLDRNGYRVINGFFGH